MPHQGRADEIVVELRRAIFAGDVQPGDAIPELHLAKRFGVSQTTVREALTRLQHSGLVRRIQNRGTFVTSLSPKELREHLRLRVVLESLAATDAAARTSPTFIRRLDQQLRALGAAIEAGDHYAAAQADLEFHRTIWLMTDDTTLYRQLDQLAVPLFAFVSMRRAGSRQDLKRAVRSHDPILNAIRNGDTGHIGELMREHIEASYVQFFSSFATP